MQALWVFSKANGLNAVSLIVGLLKQGVVHHSTLSCKDVMPNGDISWWGREAEPHKIPGLPSVVKF